MRNIISTVLSLVFFILLTYWTLPIFHWGFVGLIIQLFMTVGVFLSVQSFLTSNYQRRDIEEDVLKKTGIFISSLGVFILIVFTTTTSAFRATEYRNLIGTVHSDTFKKSLPLIDIQNAPLISEHMARQLAQKKLSDIPALGSQVIVGQLVKQNVKGKLYWVGFLEHTGAFQWYSTGKTPGYIKVSATTADDVELVTKVAGKDLEMTYLSSALFGQNSDRKIYFSGNETVGLMDQSSEIDDDGRPYIVETRVLPTIGFSGYQVLGTSILDVQTGEVKNYSVQDTPKWVDRIYPEELISSQISSWGSFVHGWFNPSNKDQLKISGSADLVYGEDGHCYFYYGITSVGQDNGIVGFMLVDSRTKNSTLYYVSGANEEVAASSVVNVIPEKGYHTTNPLPFSVSGIPTYIMTLTDSNGIPRAYGMVSIQHYQILAVSDTLKSTYQMYLNKLSRSEDSQIEEKKEPLKLVSGLISRIERDVKMGNTTYYLTLENQKHIFIATSDLNESIILSRQGDQVTISFEDSDVKLISLKSFSNKTVK